MAGQARFVVVKAYDRHRESPWKPVKLGPKCFYGPSTSQIRRHKRLLDVSNATRAEPHRTSNLETLSGPIPIKGGNAGVSCLPETGHPKSPHRKDFSAPPDRSVKRPIGCLLRLFFLLDGRIVFLFFPCSYQCPLSFASHHGFCLSSTVSDVRLHAG